jgi:hypothetical protein
VEETSEGFNRFSGAEIFVNWLAVRSPTVREGYPGEPPFLTVGLLTRFLNGVEAALRFQAASGS